MKIVGPNDPDFWDPSVFLPMLKIRAKDGGIKPFKLWDHQSILSVAVMQAYKDNKWLAHVKPRQEGSSTFFTGVVYQHTAYRSGCRSAILAHKKDTASYLASVAIRFHKHTPNMIKQTKSPGLKRTLEFPSIDSRLTIESVRAEEPLRGETVQVLLATEISSWSDTAGPDAWTSALNSISEDGGVVFAESTPKFHGDQMHLISMDASTPGSKWLKVFIPWTLVDTYAVDAPPNFKFRPEVQDYCNKHGLNPRQAAWMQMSGLPKCRNDFNRFRAEYPIDETDCWLLSGDSVFNQDILLRMLKELDGGTGLASETKEYVQHQKPLREHRYLIAVDPASSWSKRDFTGIVILDIDSCEEVASFMGHREAHSIARWLAEVGNEYNKASIYVESNGVGEAVLSHLLSLGYPRVFHRTSNNPLVKKSGSSYIPGWHSSAQRKAEAISILQSLIEDGSLTLRSRRLLQQLLNYRGQWDRLDRDAKGGHYDLVAAMSLAAWGWKNERGRRARFADKSDKVRTAWNRILRIADGGSTGWEANTPWGSHK